MNDLARHAHFDVLAGGSHSEAALVISASEMCPAIRW